MALGVDDAPAWVGAWIIAGATIMSIAASTSPAPFVFSPDPVVTRHRRARRWLEGSARAVFCLAGCQLPAAKSCTGFVVVTTV